MAVGLYRAKTLGDYVVSAVAFPLSLAIRGALGEAEVGAAMTSPAETLGEIRAACESVMPAGRFERRLFFRYTFTWRKP